MKSRKLAALREDVEKASQTILFVVDDLRAAQQHACAPGPVAKLAERRAFAILKQAIELRDAKSFDLELATGVAHCACCFKPCR